MFAFRCFCSPILPRIFYAEKCLRNTPSTVSLTWRRTTAPKRHLVLSITLRSQQPFTERVISSFRLASSVYAHSSGSNELHLAVSPALFIDAVIVNNAVSLLLVVRPFMTVVYYYYYHYWFNVASEFILKPVPDYTKVAGRNFVPKPCHQSFCLHSLRPPFTDRCQHRPFSQLRTAHAESIVVHFHEHVWCTDIW